MLLKVVFYVVGTKLFWLVTAPVVAVVLWLLLPKVVFNAILLLNGPFGELIGIFNDW